MTSSVAREGVPTEEPTRNKPTQSDLQRGPSIFFPVIKLDESRMAWHAQAKLPGRGEGLLVDVGAHDNLVGEQWVRRVIALRAERGLHDVRFEKLETPLRVEGVGKDAQTCYERAIVPINLASGETVRTQHQSYRTLRSQRCMVKSRCEPIAHLLIPSTVACTC